VLDVNLFVVAVAAALALVGVGGGLYELGRDGMLMRTLGRTGLRVAALWLGGNTFGWTTDQTTSEGVLDAYVESGGNFIDTADVYARWVKGNTGGESEAALGTWMTSDGVEGGGADGDEGQPEPEALALAGLAAPGRQDHAVASVDLAAGGEELAEDSFRGQHGSTTRSS
jgi:hypothetical protein